MSSDKILVKNCMEDAVFSTIDIVLEDFDGCKCSHCLNDIAALALNILKPQYVSTSKGEVYGKSRMLQLQYEIDVTTAIMKASTVVKKSPHHAEGE